MPEISDWNPYEDWEKAGRLDVLNIAHEKCDRILKQCGAMVLPEEIDQEIKDYIKWQLT
jgi:trimethylamine:corrinoid methyltransferase-like protein